MTPSLSGSQSYSHVIHKKYSNCFNIPKILPCDVSKSLFVYGTICIHFENITLGKIIMVTVRNILWDKDYVSEVQECYSM